MALINYATREIVFKIVYCGPALSGKTTNIEYLHSMIDPSRKGKLLSLWTGTDRVLFFDILPTSQGKSDKFSAGFQLYTIPGRVRDDTSWITLLKGSDAVIFVADSQRRMQISNIDSMHNMYHSLLAEDVMPMDIPIILQFNKRDLNDVMSLEELNEDLNKTRYSYLEAVAIDGRGVKETFQTIARLLTKQAAREPTREETQRLTDFVLTEKAASLTSTEENKNIKLEGHIVGSHGKEKSSPVPQVKDLSLLELRTGEAKRSAGFARKVTLFKKRRKKRTWLYIWILTATFLAFLIAYLLITGKW
jgi:signal recognition particle receptor subunit beta